MENDLQQKIADAIQNPKNMGALESADAIGTVGSPSCGDMVRLWIKFKEEKGRKVIDRATFQTFGCETAIAVASLATEMIRGKTAQEALSMSGTDLAGELGPLPPMKIHCGQLVEGALRAALDPASQEAKASPPSASPPPAHSPSLMDNFTQPTKKPGGVKIVFLE